MKIPSPTLPSLPLMLLLFLSHPAQGQFFPPSDVTLDPSNGGRSISLNALKEGDIIVSTTKQKISTIIRTITGSPVSHTVIYIGNNSVIEAVEEGVTLTPIEEMLSGTNLAVVFRHAGLAPVQAKTITDFAFACLATAILSAARCEALVLVGVD